MDMIYPQPHELTKGRFNRYTLVIAVAKCARMVTDEYVRQRENAERLLANKETEKSLASMIKKEFRDEKAVRTAINRLYQGSYRVVPNPELGIEPLPEEEAAAQGAEENAEKTADKSGTDERAGDA